MTKAAAASPINGATMGGFPSNAQSLTDVQSFTSAQTHLDIPSTSTPGVEGTPDLQSERATIASATSSVSLYSETDDNWATPATGSREDTSNEAGSDTESEGALSEATLPDLFPMPSSSAVSLYSNAREGSTDWVVHEEDEEEDEGGMSNQHGSIVTGSARRQEEAPPQDQSKSAVTPPVVSAPFSPLSPASAPTTPPRQVRIMLEDEDRRRTIMPDTDAVESLMITPRPRGASRSPRTPGTNNTEPFEFDRERRSPSGSVSSGSEGSVRNSMDESFRGLFFRTPQVTSPTTRRPVTAPSTAPTMIDPPAQKHSHRPGTAPHGYGQTYAHPAPPMAIEEETTPTMVAEDMPGIEATLMMPPPNDPFAHIPRPLTSVHDRQPRPLTSVHDKRVPTGMRSSRGGPRVTALGPPIGLEMASPYRDADEAKRSLRIQTNDMDNQPIPFPKGPFDHQSASAPSTNAPPSPSPAMAGLGVVMSPLGHTDELPGWDNVSRIGSSTPPIATLPRDDSWISACECDIGSIRRNVVALTLKRIARRQQRKFAVPHLGQCGTNLNTV